MNNPERMQKILEFVPGFIRNDFLRKLIALFFAILVWQRVYNQIAEPDTLRDIPVKITLPGTLERLNDVPLKVNMKIKAPRRIKNNLSVNDIHINIKIDEPAVEKNPLVISHRIDPAKDIVMPSGIHIVQIEPEIISINVDRKISKTVPVKLTYSGMLMEGYSYRLVSLIPNQVVITGPQSIIQQMKEIKTEPVPLRKENVEDFECSVDLVVKDNVIASRQKITAQFEIFKKYDVREFNDIPIKPFGSPLTPAKAILTPDKAFIIVDGVKKSVEIMNENQLHPFVDISGLKVPGKYELNVKCWLDDEFVTVKELNPKKIQVELNIP